MKQILKRVLIFVAPFLPITSYAAEMITVELKVYGMCEMCKERIEEAAFAKKESKATWNEKTKIASISYDTMKTTLEDIARRIAYAGQDNALYAAPEEAYNQLPACCKYTRELVPMTMSTNESPETTAMKREHTMAETAAVPPQENETPAAPFKAIIDSYLDITNALASDNYAAVKSNAGKLLDALKGVKMETLEAKVHTVWMDVADKLEKHVKTIQAAKDIKQQRGAFDDLSAEMYKLVKGVDAEQVLYQQFCPMYNEGKGATWISAEKAIKNPYYGKAMSTCGSTKETIKAKR